MSTETLQNTISLNENASINHEEGSGQVDAMIRFKTAVAQQGALNDRVYLLDSGNEKPSDLIPWMRSTASKHGRTRLTAKLPMPKAKEFVAAGFEIEAVVPGMYNGVDGAFVRQFLSEARGVEPTAAARIERIEKVLAKANQPYILPALPEGCVLSEMGPTDAEEISAHLSSVFDSYPFPVEDPEFIRSEMDAGTRYFAVKLNGAIIAMSSAECNNTHKYAECTDFATLPEWRGKALALHLLHHMEEALDAAGIHGHYSIARSTEFGMNLVFARAGFELTGTLINSTHIGGGIESMNIWAKYTGK
ncbi:Beta-lysine N-acetyltransferase [Carpediemonas membranifera]|uniref:Beta-lysine N-acetyltransferase n=1 Tax=Carpediemonas membranifera TaxID=201153 RepID=A0A8J6E109_9EUKA|nr:Beta-lysine N-acetyltransferase [Carpediemonas membranifera]|eukprot:KAG9395754.1 Beta-lysine N-acetyltransferase [Carpediemonas membranifera]